MTTPLARAAPERLALPPWLDHAGTAVQAGVRSGLAASGALGRRTRNLLQGVWLGHPLHAALSDWPLGAWSAAVALDAVEARLGRASLGSSADTAVGLGLVGAVVSAAAGLADWQFLEGRPQRLGLLHALLNSAATVLFGVSLGLRRRQRRRAGRQVGVLAYAAALAGAFLGRRLAYAYGIGTNHAPRAAGPTRFEPVLPVVELAEGRLCRAEAGGVPLVLVRRGDRIYALAETCAHLGGPLANGWLVEDGVVCPWHQSRFALADGAVRDGPAVYRQPAYDTRVRNGQVEVRLRRGA